MPSVHLLQVCAVVAVIAWPTMGSAAEKVDVPVRGKPLTLTIYKPNTPRRGTIVMGSGDVGWVGLAASMADELSAQGYIVVGINARQYLAAFTSGQSHLERQGVPATIGSSPTGEGKAAGWSRR